MARVKRGSSSHSTRCSAALNRYPEGMSRNGPKRRSRRALSTASRMEQTEDAPTMAGSALGGEVDRNRLSRVVLAATCQAIMIAATNAARRPNPELDQGPLLTALRPGKP